MRVVVLGASGNAGTALLRALEAEPAVGEVVAAARRPPDRWESAKTVWRAVDVVADPLEPVLAGADAVVHLAWLIQPSRDREQTRAVNVGGSRRVMEAVAAAGVRSLVYASSVGAYSPGPKDRRVDETWPTGGVPSSFYSRDKAEVEWLLDAFERAHPDIRVVRLRPGLIFQRGAASEIRRLFAGPFLPSRLVHPKWIPIVPRHPRLRFQAVHADDVADAYRRAIVGDARGAFNVAAEPVLDGEALGRLLRARPVPVPAPVLRGGAAAAFHLRLTPTPRGLGRHGARRPAHGQHAGARGARLAADPRRRRDAARAARGHPDAGGLPHAHARARRRRPPARARDPQRRRRARTALTGRQSGRPGMARAMTATRQALPLAVAVLALAGCGRAGDRASARSVAESFYAAARAARRRARLRVAERRRPPGARAGPVVAVRAGHRPSEALRGRGAARGGLLDQRRRRAARRRRRLPGDDAAGLADLRGGLPRPRLRHAGHLRAAVLMRAMFITYLVLVVAGLAYFVTIGVLHH